MDAEHGGIVHRKGMTWHGAVPCAAQVLPDSALEAYIRHVPGAITVFDVRRAIAIALEEGRTHVPPCSYVDRFGYCRGHYDAKGDTWGT